MKILFLNPIGRIGGAEKVLLDVIASLTVEGNINDIAVILLSDGPLLAELLKLGVNAVVEPLPRSIAELGDSQLIQTNRQYAKIKLLGRLVAGMPALVRYVARLRGLLKQLRPDLVYSNGLKTHLLSVLVKPNAAKLAWHLHDFYGARPTVGKLIGLAANRVDWAVAISRSVQQDVQRLAPCLKTYVVYNAVNPERFRPIDRALDDSLLDRLADLGAAPAGVLRYGLIATYANWKGHRAFLEALAIARSQIGGAVRGYIIGGPVYVTSGSQVTELELRRMIHELCLDDHVGLVPFREDLNVIYQLLDIVVHASTRPEPFGLTIAEAMTCGRPVIVSAAGGAKELFTEGVDALGHAPGNVNQLADAMTRLGIDPSLRQSLAANARLASKSRFSFDRFREELTKCLQSQVR